MPKILFLVTEDWYFWSHRRPLAQAALKAGFEVLLATHVDRHRVLIEADGVTVLPLSLRRSSRNPFRELLSLLEVANLYLTHRPDLVHHVAHKPVLYGSVAARLTGVPAVVNALGGLGYAFIASGWRARIRRHLLSWAYKLALGGRSSRLILQNDDDLAVLVEEGMTLPEAVTVIRGSGVDLDEFKPSPEAPGVPLVLMSSRLLWDKGAGEFVAAAIALRQAGVKARFALAGDVDADNPAAVPSEEIERWRREGDVEIWGRRDDMPAVYAQAHVVCLPSYREGFPKALIEAAACGRAMVAADVPGCREVVRSGDNGLLVPPRDAVALAEALRRLIEDPLLRARMARRSREIAVAEFSQADVVERTLEVYSLLLEGTARAGLPPTPHRSPKTSILYLVTEDWYFCLHHLAVPRAALRAGYQVTVATRVQNHGAQITREGFKLIPIGLRRRSLNPFQELRSILELRALYAAEKPDLAHHVALKPVLYGSLAAWLAGVPWVVNTSVGLGFTFIASGWKRRALRVLTQRVLGWALAASRGRAIFQNPDDLAVFEGLLPRERAVVIRGSAGVDLSAFVQTPEPPGPPIVLLAGRMLWDKGIGQFVEAAAQLREEGSNARFVLVGEGDADNPAAIKSSQLRAWAESGVVEWWGRRDDMPAVTASCHIACLPSYREGLPQSLLEAAACGRPIVATDVPGCREVVTRGRNGLLVPARDARALADALRILLKDAGLRARMGQAGRDLVAAEFSQAGVVQRTLDIYSDLLGGGAR